MTASVVVIFCILYLGMILGGLPFLSLNRTGIALLGAIALLTIGVARVGPGATRQGPADDFARRAAAAGATRRRRFGDPRQRDPEKVRADVRNGLVSADAARQAYGVNTSREGDPASDGN
jgi:hypothetical protein